MENIVVDRIISVFEECKITGYEVAQNTSLTEVGINKILNRSSKNPRKSTLDIIITYLHNNYNYSKDWLSSGSGNKLNSNTNNYEDLNIISLISYLLDKKEILIQDETFRNYIRATYELVVADDEREKKNKALEELRKIALSKHKK